MNRFARLFYSNALIWLLLYHGQALAQPTFTFSSQGRKGGTFSPVDIVARQLQINQNPDIDFMDIGGKAPLNRQETQPRTGRAVVRMASFLMRQGDVEKAIALYEESAKLDPKLHYDAGWAYLYTFRDYSRAIRHFDAYDALTPNFDDSNGFYPISYLKGLAYRNRGDHAEAILQFNKGIDSLAKKHGSEWVNYKQYVSRAASYLALQQFDKALPDLDSAAHNATSESPLVLYYKAKIAQVQGRSTEAKRMYQDAFFFWQANRVKGITQPEDNNNPVTEADIEAELKQ